MARSKAVRCQAMMGGKLMFPNDYLAACELQDKDWTLTIAAIKSESLRTEDGGTEAKWTVRFKETPKKLVLNKTNARSIAAVHGNDADTWIGKRIVVYPTQTSAFGAMVDCIRVREKAPAEKPAGTTKNADGKFADDIASMMEP